jgi:uncharacterized cupin superfamily protein
MTKIINDVIDFATNQIVEKIDIVPQERVVAGIASDANTKITMKTFNHYTDPSEQFFAGIWQSSVGAKNVNYTEEEVCVILEGRVRLTDLNGNSKEFGTGSIFAVPAGFKGTWETIEAVKKVYVIWESK